MPTAFDQVQPNSLVSNPCTPKPAKGDYAYRGIMLAAPEVAEFTPDGHSRDLASDAFGDLVVCGSATFDYNFMGLKGHFLYSIAFTAVERTSHKAYTGTIPAPGRVVLPPQVEVSQEEGANRVITKYFNPNLIFILGLPPQEGTYDVHAQLGDQRSNTVTIQLKQAGR